MDDVQAAVLRTMVENAQAEKLLELAARIADARGLGDQAKYQIIIELLANDPVLLSKLRDSTAQKLIAAAKNLGVWKGEHG